MGFISKSYLSPSMLKVLEILERIEKLTPTAFSLQNSALHAHQLGSLLSVSAFLYQQKGINGMFKKASFTERMLRMYGNSLYEQLENYLSELEASNIFIEEFNEVDFFPEKNASSKIILREIPKVEKLMGEIYVNNHKLYQISPSDFEEMMAEYLRNEGWDVRLTKKTRDGGYDIVALQHIGSLPFKIIAECKRFTPKRKVGIDILRGFQTVMLKENANKGIIFTSSYFSSEVRKEKDICLHHQIDLRDYDDIMSWINATKNS